MKRFEDSSEDRLNVAAVQLSSQDDVHRNLATVRVMVVEASARGAHLVVLPEGLAYMGQDSGRLAAPLAKGSVVFDALSNMARDAGVWAIAGGIPETSPDPFRPFNTCAVFRPDGFLHASYRKIHLFDVDLPGAHMLESKAYLAGNDPCCITIEGFRVGLSICYDLRFPELYRHLANMGAEVLVVPSAFTITTGKDHWHVLLRARAIENQAYVIAPAQFGRHPHRSTYGKTLIVDPWGTVVAQCSDGLGFCQHTLDKAYLVEVRASLPALGHRRLG